MRSSLKGKKILVTCGPTWVAIDPVRVISNVSSGELGQLLTKALLKQGARVTLLEGPVANPFADRRAKVIRFRFFDELHKTFRQELGKHYAAVVHAAAVADFQPVRPSPKKIDSRGGRLKLELMPTPKLINAVKRTSPQTFLVGFKLRPGLTQRSAQAASRELFKDAHCDLVVANTCSKAGYRAWILDTDVKVLTQASSRRQLVEKLTQLLSQRL